MFQSKVDDQERDLLNTFFGNVRLKEKCQSLDVECKALADTIIASQLSRAEENETLIPLKKQLISLRQQQAQKLNELNVCNKAIGSMLAALQDSGHEGDAKDALKDEELLKFKDEMIKCLQEELVQMRLNAAENHALIRELTEVKNGLEADYERMVKTKPDTVSVLQEELMAAKVRTASALEEFEAIRKFLGSMKEQVQHHVEEVASNQSQKSEGVLNFSPKAVLWRSSSRDSASKHKQFNESIQQLDEEAVTLRSKISELSGQVELINKQLQFKEKKRRSLQQDLDNVRIKVHSDESMVKERQRQYAHLEETADEKLKTIRSSIDEKNEDIDLLSLKVHRLSQSAGDAEEESASEAPLSEDDLVHKLEDEIAFLEHKVVRLRREVKNRDLESVNAD